jgi:hypothetical protein
MTNLAIAQEIKNQLGNGTLCMLGAKNLGAGENYLQFQIQGSKTFSHIRITLNGKDLYDVTFYKIVKYDIKKQETVNDVYNDMVKKLIEEKTRLYTSL